MGGRALNLSFPLVYHWPFEKGSISLQCPPQFIEQPLWTRQCVRIFQYVIVNSNITTQKVLLPHLTDWEPEEKKD